MLLRNARTTKSKKGCLIAAFLVLLCFVTGACSSHRPVTTIDLSDSTKWREGDISLRCGWGMESRAVTARGQSTYSHAGLLHHDSGSNCWQVIHAVPGEDDPEYVKAEAVAVFYGPDRARTGAWLRIDCDDSTAYRATQYALWKAEQKVLFDNDYLLEDTTMLYCTELVWRSYQTAGIDISDGNRHDVSRFFCTEGECIFPDDIERSNSTIFVQPLKSKEL